MSATAKLCPGCDGFLRDWAVGPTTVDGCDACGGVWFDADELKAVANLPGEPLEALEGEFRPGLLSGAGGAGQCPVDQTVLAGHAFRHAADVQVLACPTCRGLWLGHDQLDALARRLPKHSGPMPMGGTTSAGITAVAGLVRTCRCPACDAPNPDLEPRCCQCGADLHAPPAHGTGTLLDSYPYAWGRGVLSLVWLGLGLVVLTTVSPITELSLARALAPACPSLPVWVLVGLWALRWPLKTYRVDASTGGLTLHRLLGPKYIPWDRIHKVLVFDLGSRSIWQWWAWMSMQSRYDPILQWERYNAYMRADEHYSEHHARSLVVLYTSRGLYTLAPDFDRHWEMVSRICQHE